MTAGLDKSLPFEKIVMRFPAERLAEVPEPVLPDGYTFHMYQRGDIRLWAELETSVDEFRTEADAEAYFQKDFLPYETELPERMMFVLAPDGSPAGTCTAWFYPQEEREISLAHWMCVLPAHQGLGLSRRMMQWILRYYAENAPEKDVYLKTQTWSHKAVGLYLRMGYRPVSENCPVLRSANHYEAAKNVLAQVLPAESFTAFCESVD